MSKLPKFKTLDEMVAFWETHDFTDYMDEMEEVSLEEGLPNYQPETETKTYDFTVVFSRDTNSRYQAFVPALPDCVAEGNTLEEAEKLIKVAIQSYCENLLNQGKLVPKERPGDQFIGRLEVAVKSL